LGKKRYKPYSLLSASMESRKEQDIFRGTVHEC
jgi:hypothetical protein